MNVFETLDARRILASSEIHPHQFLFEWHGNLVLHVANS